MACWLSGILAGLVLQISATSGAVKSELYIIIVKYHSCTAATSSNDLNELNQIR